MSVACTGPAGCSGFQVCKPDGGGYLRCNCMTSENDSAAGAVEAGAIYAGDTGAIAGDGGASDAPLGAMDANNGEGPDASGPASGPVAVSPTPQTVLETEVQVAVAPDGTIAIAWIAEGPADIWIGYRFSTDGGATFSPIGRMQIPPGLAGSDPALAVDSAGNFYLSALGVHFVGTSADYTRVFVAKATSSTMTFAAPVEVVSSSQPMLYDHPKILVTAKGTVVLGFSQSPVSADGGPPTTSIGRVATSKDGQSWQVGTIVGPPSVLFANLFWFCEGDGILYATYLESTALAGYIALRSSPDDGATWTASSTAVSLATEIVSELDPTCVAHGSDVWIAYCTTASPTTDPMNFLDSARAIRVAHSADRGNVVGTTRTAALDTAAGALGLMPVLVRESGGAFDVAYLTGSAEGDTMGSMRYVREAADAGFAPSIAVDGPLTFTMNRSKTNWLGDYLGAVAFGNRLLIAYPMNAGGATHVYFRSMPLQ
jgi:hypothetical protein